MTEFGIFRREVIERIEVPDAAFPDDQFPERIYACA